MVLVRLCGFRGPRLPKDRLRYVRGVGTSIRCAVTVVVGVVVVSVRGGVGCPPVRSVVIAAAMLGRARQFVWRAQLFVSGVTERDSLLRLTGASAGLRCAHGGLEGCSGNGWVGRRWELRTNPAAVLYKSTLARLLLLVGFLAVFFEIIFLSIANLTLA